MENDDNIYYIDEHRKWRWLRNLDRARQIGMVAIPEHDTEADVLPIFDPDSGTDSA